jgi:hypothetical protein
MASGREKIPVGGFQALSEHLVKGREQVPVAVKGHGFRSPLCLSARQVLE